MRSDTITAVGADYVLEGDMKVNFEADKLPTPVLAQNAVVAHRIRKDIFAATRNGLLVGRIQGALFVAAMWLLWWIGGQF